MMTAFRSTSFASFASFPSLATLTLLAAALASLPAAHAVPLPAYPTAASGPSTTAWFPDRYPPANFSNAGTLFGRDNVLDLSIAVADGPASRAPPYDSAFYNTQGRKVDIDAAPPVSWIGSLYIPASWATTNPGDATLTRRSDLWATLQDAGGAGIVYPIIGFTNSDPATFNGGTPRLRVWDSSVGWLDLATPVPFGGWADFCVTWTGTTVEYRVGDTLVFTDSNGAIATTTLAADVMLQAYNFNHAYTSHWSHVAAGSATCAELRADFAPPTPWTPAQPVPVGPFAPLLSALAIALAFVARQRVSPRR